MTAVEWLINELHKKQNGKGSNLSYNHIFDEAKKMETQQIKEAYLRGIKNYDPTFKSEQDEDSNTTSN